MSDIVSVTSGKSCLALLATKVYYCLMSHESLTERDALITRDRAQFSDPRECDAIKKSGLHHIRYAQRQEGMRGLALAVGAIIAAMPMVMQELEAANGQRLVQIANIEPRRRFEITDPQRNPPSAYWPH
jgi:hypothetical protein